jgi:hypothetical protein
MAQFFRVRAHRPETRMPGDTWPKMLPGEYLEPVEASDAAELWLRTYGKDGQSFCDLLFNGDIEPHSSIFRISHWKFGIWNREGVPWPIDYIDPETGGPNTLPEHPHFIAEGEDDLPPAPPPAEEGSHKKGEADEMKIDGEDDEEEEEGWDDDEEADTESDSDGDDSEDYPEDDEDEEDAEDGSEDDTDDESQGEDDDEFGDDGDDEDEDDSENDVESDEVDDEDENDEEDDEDESESETEPEMPRLTIFAKMRGPKGWRKRADAEELNTTNTFGLKIGVVNEEGETPGQQEKNVRAEIQFIEDEENRTSGILRIRAHDDLMFERRGKWLVAEIPYYDEDES